jgi:phosphatidylethanolamine-binding protein (PEBP) family uncharacterized protein
MTLALTSPAFADGEPIPSEYTCDDADRQLPLAWSGTPAGTVEFALIFDDPDAGGFVHWVVTGIPADTSEMGDELPAGAVAAAMTSAAADMPGRVPRRGTRTA